MAEIKRRVLLMVFLVLLMSGCGNTTQADLAAKETDAASEDREEVSSFSEETIIHGVVEDTLEVETEDTGFVNDEVDNELYLEEKDQLGIDNKASPKVLQVTGLLSFGAVLEDGSLWTWGDNRFGQLGTGDTEDRSTPTKVLDNVRSAKICNAISAAVLNDNTLWIWGYCEPYERFGFDDSETDGSDQTTPLKIMDDVEDFFIFDTAFVFAAIKTNGDLWMWGYNDNGQLGIGTTTELEGPTYVTDNVKTVCDGYSVPATSIIKKDGSLWMWGGIGLLDDYGIYNDYNNHGDPIQTEPIKILDNVVDFGWGERYAAVLQGNGNVLMWGDLGFYADNGDGQYEHFPNYLKQLTLVLEDAKSICVGSNHCSAIKNDGSLWMWGNIYYSPSYDGGAKAIEIHLTEPTWIMDSVREAQTESDSMFVIKEDGTLWSWGNNGAGELGDISYPDREADYTDTPSQIMSDVSSIIPYCGQIYGAIKNDGSLWLWGYGSDGQLGNGDEKYHMSYYPRQVIFSDASNNEQSASSEGSDRITVTVEEALTSSKAFSAEITRILDREKPCDIFAGSDLEAEEGQGAYVEDGGDLYIVHNVILREYDHVNHKFLTVYGPSTICIRKDAIIFGYQNDDTEHIAQEVFESTGTFELFASSGGHQPVIMSSVLELEFDSEGCLTRLGGYAYN